ncbi:hypothetical protein OSSY52_16900 [Tepiditoga spiralis]|uniref:4Fe-4S ferredoxin-type domain-containing protein n=1 Tax=Tepiditoga spiralis TaxID=2108365 RepID=A0A7G1GC03_9BACT|nr:ferredoxin family protein [Tepiditoga spiralis]BBE31549.1 hypothetical protein OSSY52_16900 [Tepiditoga spiralis]
MKDWKIYYEEMKSKTNYTIDYPICGGAGECITACPRGKEIWKFKTMKVSLMGIDKRIRKRPVMIHPELCLNCNSCIMACPTGALRNKEKTIKSRFFSVFYNTLRLPFKKKYNLKFLSTEEHKKAFLENNKKLGKE